ncbi:MULTISPECIES: AMIN-like domain-containing (lipo)protein [unclassified Blastococcus]
MSRPRPLLRLAVVLGAVLASVTALAGPAAAAPYCGITWGSLPEVSSAPDSESLNGVRSGRHACFDRLVLDVGGQDATFGTYTVEYVPVVRADGSGAAVPVRGAADLQVVVGAPAHDAAGNPTVEPANRSEVVDVTGYTTFRQVAWAGSFEGQTTLALGVRARLPFRVFVLPGTPNTDHTPRLVIDVAHRW